MPSLRKLDIRIPPVQPRNKDLRASMRNDLAAVLDDWTLEQLEYLSIEMEDSTPQNHTFSNSSALDENYPADDHLSRALYMGPEVLISPVLFGVDSRHPERAEMTFPYLTRMQVNYARVTYDGQWYYDGDGEGDPDGLDWDVPPRVSDDDSATNSSNNSEYADNLNEELNALPNPPFANLIHSLISAVKRMPSNCALEVKANNPGANEYDIGIEYVSPGYRARGTMRNPKYDTEEMLAVKRYVLSYRYNAEWDVPTDSWEMMQDQVEEVEGKGKMLTV
ncbi:hypothetical protein BDW69DRAFT_188958 [Aspergillus filifer]